MKTYLKFLTLSLILGLSSCIDELRDYTQVTGERYLSVEASLSDLKGPHRVYLSFSSPNININTESTPITGATVFFEDDLGKQERLSELSGGVYESSATFQGVVGRSYTLNITLQNGKKYKSTPEQIMASPAIDSVYTQFKIDTDYPTNDARRYAFQVFADFKDPESPQQYYEWKWTHYERTLYCASCERGYDYIQNKCSIENNFPLGQTFPELINYKCSETCFDIAYSTLINILSDNLLNGQTIRGIKVASVPYTDKSLYYLKIEQRAIPTKLYQYLRTIKNVSQSSGTLFDVPAETQFSPNITSVDFPEEKILGVFEVFGAKQKIVYIDRSIGSDGYTAIPKVYQGRTIPPPPGAISGPQTPCIEGKYRTKKEPEAWRE